MEGRAVRKTVTADETDDGVDVIGVVMVLDNLRRRSRFLQYDRSG